MQSERVTCISFVLTVSIILTVVVPIIALIWTNVRSVQSELKAVEATLAAVQASISASTDQVVQAVQAIPVPPPPPAADVYTLDANCDDGKVCTIDYLVSPRYTCVNQALPGNTSCVDPSCYRGSLGTHCDPKTGSCVSSVASDCWGNAYDAANHYVCNKFNGIFAIPSLFFHITDPFVSFFGQFYNSQVNGWYNICEMYVVILDILPTNVPDSPPDDINNGPVPLGLFMTDCRDILDPTIAARSYDCIIGERFVIETNLTKALIDSYYGAPGGDPAFRNASFQFGVCMYRYACSRLDMATVSALTANMTNFTNSTTYMNHAIAADITDSASSTRRKRATSAVEAVHSIVHKNLYTHAGNREALGRWTNDLPSEHRRAYGEHAAAQLTALVLDTFDQKLSGTIYSEIDA